MKLPNADQVVVEQEKIADYLLNAAHPDNGGKAQFYEGLGFHRSEWKALTSALLVLARNAEVAQSSLTPHGEKFVIIGRIESPNGRAGWVRTVWIVDSGSETARLVTAYPGKEGKT